MEFNNSVYDELSAARYLGGIKSPISVRTMQRWRLEGLGPRYIKLGRLVRYRQSDLDEFIQLNCLTATSNIKS